MRRGEKLIDTSSQDDNVYDNDGSSMVFEGEVGTLATGDGGR